MDFNTRYYITESIQQILKSLIGDNCVIQGMNILHHHMTDDYNIFLEVSSGKIIVDGVLIEFPNDFSIIHNIIDLPKKGVLVLVVHFKYIRTSRLNTSIISLKYIDDDNKSNDWFVDKDRLILAKINYDKDIKKTTLTVSDVLNREFILINNINYEIRPLGLIIDTIRPYLIRS